jgi:hypothetical protein
VSDRRVAISCGIIAIAVSGVTALATISAQHWSVTTLVRTASDDPLAAITRRIDPAFQFTEPGGHYDGSFFYAIAIDPLARGQAHELIDRRAYRYAHPGYGWAAWLVSLGRPSLVPAALLVIGLLSLGVAAWAAALIAAHFGWSPWWGGLIVALSPGLVFSVLADTSEPLGFALGAGMLLAWIHKKWIWVAALSMAACFVKEPLLALPIGLVAWELVEARRGRPSPDIRTRLFALAPGLVALGLWLAYVTAVFGVWPSSQAADAVALPPFGWIDTLHRAAEMVPSGNEAMQIGAAALAFLPVIGTLLIIGIVKAVRLRTFLDVVFLLLAAITLSLNELQLLNPKDLIRVTALSVALIPAVLATPRKTELVR